MEQYLSKIPDQWIQTKGIGVKVGIIDSGFDVENKYIKESITKIDDYGSTDIDHGTHVMGIMCMNSGQTNAVQGLAQYANYYLASIPMGQKNGMLYIVDALRHMISYNIDVLNMSFTNYMQNKQMKKLLFQLYKKNTILIAAYSENLLFPHSYPFVISAGKEIITQSSFYSCISNNKFKRIAGTSMQCAYISSVAAIAKSFDKKIGKSRFIDAIAGSKIRSVNNNSISNIKRQINLIIKN